MRTLSILVVISAVVVTTVLTKKDAKETNGRLGLRDIIRERVARRNYERSRRELGNDCLTCQTDGEGDDNGYEVYSYAGRRSHNSQRGRGGSSSSSSSSSTSSSSESNERGGYDNGGDAPSCRCPFLTPGPNEIGGFNDIELGGQTSQGEAYYRQLYQAFINHPCCAGGNGFIAGYRRSRLRQYNLQ